MGAELYGCRMTGSWSGVFSGRMEHCRWQSGITLAAPARLYHTTVIGDLDFGGTAAGVALCVATSKSDSGSASIDEDNVWDPDVN